MLRPFTSALITGVGERPAAPDLRKEVELRWTHTKALAEHKHVEDPFEEGVGVVQAPARLLLRVHPSREVPDEGMGRTDQAEHA